MLMQSGLKLLDFGIAELRYSDQQWMARPKQRSGVASPGTLAYMSPEQIEGGETDVRTDIFGFGLVTYQMVTGQPAFRGADHAALSQAILHDNPAPASQLAAHIPPALDFLLERCLAKVLAERWQSIADVLLMLRWIASSTLTWRRITLPERRLRWKPIDHVSVKHETGLPRLKRRGSEPLRVDEARVYRLAAVRFPRLSISPLRPNRYQAL